MMKNKGHMVEAWTIGKEASGQEWGIGLETTDENKERGWRIDLIDHENPRCAVNIMGVFLYQLPNKYYPD